MEKLEAEKQRIAELSAALQTFRYRDTDTAESFMAKVTDAQRTLAQRMTTNEEVEEICFMNSRIASAVSDIEGSRLLDMAGLNQLKLWFGGAEIRLHLLYRATQDGFQAPDFHSHCDNHGPTLSLVKSANSQVIGGFTAVSWACRPGQPPYQYKADS